MGRQKELQKSEAEARTRGQAWTRNARSRLERQELKCHILRNRTLSLSQRRIFGLATEIATETDRQTERIDFFHTATVNLWNPLLSNIVMARMQSCVHALGRRAYF